MKYQTQLLHITNSSYPSLEDIQENIFEATERVKCDNKSLEFSSSTFAANIGSKLKANEVPVKANEVPITANEVPVTILSPVACAQKTMLTTLFSSARNMQRLNQKFTGLET